MKKYNFAATFTVIWLLFILIPRSNIYPTPVHEISILTLTQSGLNNNIFLLFRTFAERSIYAYRVTSLVTPIAKEKNPFKSITNSVKNEISRYRNSVSDVIPLLCGAGIILILYNLYAGTSPRKSIATLAVILFTLRSLSRCDWFYIRFLISLNGKIKSFTKGRIDVKKIVTGMSAGLVLSIPVSFIPYTYICIITGCMLIITAVIISVKVTYHTEN
ncbi:MAG: hypothetical protein ACYCWE_03920 [Eubacteriales bacterium]